MKLTSSRTNIKNRKSPRKTAKTCQPGCIEIGVDGAKWVVASKRDKRLVACRASHYVQKNGVYMELETTAGG